VHQIGGYKVQGKGETAAQQLLREAKQLEQAGAGMIVLEAIPAALAGEVTRSLKVPTIGIGAGVECSGQVLVLYDMLEIFPGRKAKFVKNFLRGAGSIQAAVELYVKEVKNGSFPGAEHSFSA
jgi:3-methyl-2-oxobutanoate hydroxymethyltransferase